MLVKITELNNIGSNISYQTLIPVVDTAGNATTEKANLQIVGNLILNGAGGSNFPRAAQANIALSVANAAQPNITSVGTLTNLTVSGNVTANLFIGNILGNLTNAVFATNAGNVTNNAQPNITSVGTLVDLEIAGNLNGYSIGNIIEVNLDGNSSNVLHGDGSWSADITDYGNSNVANYLPTFTGNIGNLSFQYANTIGTILGKDGSFLKLFGPDDTILGCDTGNTAVWSNGKVEIRSGIDGINDKITSFYANGDIEFFDGAILSSGGLYGNSTAVLGNKGGEVQVYAQNAGVGIQTYTGSAYNTWTFDNTGNLVLPSNTFAVKYANGTTVSLGGGVQSQIANGTSNVNIATSGGNVTVKAGSAGNWTFGTDAVLSAPNGSQIVPAGNNFNIYTNDVSGAVQFFTDVTGNNHNWAFDGYGYTQLPFSQGFTNTAVLTSTGAGNLMIQAGAGPAQNFLFGSDGNLTLPGAIDVGNMVIGTVAGDITADNNTTVAFNVTGSDGGFLVNYLKEVGNANTSGGELAFSSETGNATYRISLSDDLGDGFATKIWRFDGTGNLTLPGNTFAVNYANGTQVSLGGGGNTGNVTFSDQVVQGTGDEEGGGGLYLAPGTNSTANLQYLRVRGGDYPTHIHLDTGNNNYFDQYFGADFRYVKLEANGNIVINADDDAGASATWTFDTTGNLVLAGGNSIIQSIANSSLDPTNPNVSTMTLTPDANYNSQVLVLDPTAPGHIHLRAYASSNIDDPAANIFLGGEQTAFEVTSGPNNVAKIHSGNLTWTFSNTSIGNVGYGVLELPGESYIRSNQDTVNIQSVDANGIGRGIYIGSGGGLYFWDGNSQSVSLQQDNTNANLTAIGNASITSNVSTWIFGIDGNLTLPGGYTIGEPGGPSLRLQAPNTSSQIQLNWANEVSLSLGNTGAANIAQIGTAGGTWNFDETGNLTLPNNTFSINYANGSQASAPLVDITDTNGLTTVYYPTFVENRTTGQIVRADVDLSYRTDTNTLTLGNITGNTNGYTLGYLNIPQIVASNTTLTSTDGGKHYYSTTVGNLTLTIPNNSTTSFATGTAISIVVQAAGNVLVNAASGVTLYMAGSSSAGNRAVGSYGMATLMKVASDTWFINGTGVY